MSRSIRIIVIVLLIVVLMFAVILLLFPRRHNDLIEKYSKEYNLSKSMIASIINIESRYDEGAVSDAGAIGLMQILPSTAEDCAKRIGLAYSTEVLHDPKTNIQLGCFYLSYLLELFEGNLINSLCAYNWGLGNVQNWINLGNKNDDGTIINIPVKETQNYITKYRVNYFVYSKVYNYD